MLGLMRKYAYSWTLRILLIVISGVFVFWGVGTGFFSQVHPVATVNHQRILADQLDQETTRLRARLQQMYGSNAPAVLKGINLREEALEIIIQRMLINSEARRLGLQVSKTALEQSIASQPAFQVNGHFDFRTYEAVLRDNDLLPAQYESSQRTQLLANELRNMVAQGVQISDGEAHRLFDLQNEMLSLSYFEIPYVNFVSGINPAQKQIADYYSKNSGQFRVPDRIKLAYIFYNPAELGAQSKPNDKQIAEYYNSHRNTLFSHPGQVHARHILIAVPPNATAKQKAAAKAKSEKILKQLEAGADFASLARKYSDDPSARQNGGDLGFFTRGEMIKPFADAAFNLKPKHFTVAESKFGFHVIQVLEVKAAHVESLDEARASIVKAIERKSGAGIARSDLDRDLSEALSGVSLGKIAKQRGLDKVITPLFAQAAAPKPLSNDPKVIAQAFNMQKGDVRAITGKQAMYLIKLVGRDPAHIPPLKEIQAKVRQAYITTAAERQAGNLANKLLAGIKNVDDFKKAAAANKFDVYTTPDFARSSRTVPGIGDLPEVTDAAALVPKVPSVIHRVMDHDGDAYLFAVMERKSPDGQAWKAAAPTYKKELLQARREQTWEGFLDVLKSRAHIKVDPNQLGGTSSPASM
ncbi:MAG: SurA N-terminal domain-containing protein [Candidatus Binataceae bacterium]